MRAERRRHLGYEVGRLHRAGRSQREIARSLGIARATVRSLLAELGRRRRDGEAAPEREIGRRTPKPSKLDDFEELMVGWLDEYPKLTARRCLEKLREEGFEGGYTIVRERMRALRAARQPERGASTPVVTAPGQRAEFDWSPYELVRGVKVQLWNATLRWSRAPSLAAADNVRQTTTLRLLRESFERWHGVPLECLTDSMPGVVDRWEANEPVLNVRYVDFAAYYGFTALIAPRGCPQWKAIAERLFRYHEGNLLNGRTIRSVEEYVELLAWWKEAHALERDHPETGRPIRAMLDLERAELQPLPARPYDTRDVVVRVVDDYRRVRFETNHYPVPAPIGDLVYVCADAERVEVCDRGARRLIEHERLPDGAKIRLDPPQSKRARYDVDELVARVGDWGEVAATFAEGVRATRRTAGAELVRLLQLRVDWALDDVVEALERAIAYRCFEVTKVRRILEARYTPRRFEEQIADATRERIARVMETRPVRPRPLDGYEALRRGDAAVETPEEDEDDDGAGEDIERR